MLLILEEFQAESPRSCPYSTLSPIDFEKTQLWPADLLKLFDFVCKRCCVIWGDLLEANLSNTVKLADLGRDNKVIFFRTQLVIWMESFTFHLLNPYVSRTGQRFGVEGMNVVKKKNEKLQINTYITYQSYRSKFVKRLDASGRAAPVF